MHRDGGVAASVLFVWGGMDIVMQYRGNIIRLYIEEYKVKRAMKRFILTVIILSATVLSAVAQNPSRREARREGAEQKAMAKRLAEMQDSLAYVEAMEAVDNMDFVFEANMLVFKRGGTARVYSNLNFVSVRGENALIQVSPITSGGGQNGVGGVTVDGRITNIERSTDKRGTTTLSINVMGRAISAVVTFTIPKGSNSVTVRISPNLNSNTITLYGVLLPRDQSNIFKGITL